jgi:hypothetical protein
MSKSSQDQLRQIKWILAGILACLVVIVFALVPDLLKLIAVAFLTAALAIVLWTLSDAVRAGVRHFWRELVVAIRGR